MVSARITRILYALYLLIISVVLLAEATVFYLMVPTALLQITTPLLQITTLLLQIITPLLQIILFASMQAILQTMISLYIPLIITATLAFWSFFLFTSGYAISLASSPEAPVSYGRWLPAWLSLCFLVTMPLFTSLFQAAFQNAPLPNPYWTIIIMTAILVFERKRLYGAIQWGYRRAHAYWNYARHKRAREFTAVFLFAFITAQASLMRIQLPVEVYYALFLFGVGYTASVALFPEIRTLDKLWLSLGMSLAFLILTPLILRMVTPLLYIQFPSTPEILTLVTVILFAVLLKRLATT